jgi:D-3-phosphoglycerate dehydrogenase
MTNTDHIKLPDSVKMISLKGEKAFLGTVKSTAEHTLYLMLNLMKKTSRKEDPGHTLFDKHLGIIGSGRVGKQVARMFKHVTMSDLKVNAEVYRADIISIHASVIKGKYPCLGERQLSQVKDGAFIINTSRPCHVDVAAMLKHIDRLGGFASDFILPSVLAEKKNVIYTEHTGGYTWTDLIRTSSFCFSKLMGELNVEDEKWEAFASED